MMIKMEKKEEESLLGKKGVKEEAKEVKAPEKYESRGHCFASPRLLASRSHARRDSTGVGRNWGHCFATGVGNTALQDLGRV